MAKKTDTVVALLTPREAILNRNAAELMGRKKIAALNAKGNKLAEKGIDLPSYQSGTSDVGNDRTTLLQDVDDSFYGGGQSGQKKPSPTPTPKPRKYQYGTSNVYTQRRAVDMAGPTPISSPPFRFRDAGGGSPISSPVGSTGSFGSQNVTAGSFGTSPFGSPVPDLSYADPRTLGRLNISNLIYSVSAGGYLTRSEAENANSYYNKFGAGGGGDPTANRAASSYYNYIGSLPTRPTGTPALNNLYSQDGNRPPPGPSYNSILGGAGLRGGYTGPFGFGNQNPNYTPFGVRRDPGTGGSPMTGTAW